MRFFQVIFVLLLLALAACQNSFAPHLLRLPPTRRQLLRLLPPTCQQLFHLLLDLQVEKPSNPKSIRLPSPLNHVEEKGTRIG